MRLWLRSRSRGGREEAKRYEVGRARGVDGVGEVERVGKVDGIGDVAPFSLHWC